MSDTDPGANQAPPPDAEPHELICGTATYGVTTSDKARASVSEEAWDMLGPIVTTQSARKPDKD
ncbi:MAG TPA: hypothetical protein VLA88_04415 [Candidatus Saccharimonadales bacterium]|nr:hypothetical protein [Candidatus Saccharimonadales bacterium]